ncbi:AttL [uncultured Pleomorphomonas sp.]|uniref:Alcohol dehydrogenase 2 n=1 Tax=uncultured Pleomorphomonas sp. TaxID=442121 RepID=A0A212LG48_9HYPH|nr:iron-containing alcohol dehydrogenase [uncultured Pleomorphomonas sp.]SCM76468.1 AttL [uncultured Pleomorphomonas sp.]
MTSFTFETTPALINAWGAAGELGSLLAGRFSARTALIVTFASFVRSGRLDPILASLHDAGFETQVFDRVVADPPEALVMEAVDLARQSGTNIVLGVGGGSSLDTAKLVAVLAGSRQPIGEIYGIGKVRGARLPLVLVPTTAGTGSEVTAISIVTTGESTKMGVVAPQLYPDLAVLDAELTVGLPKVHTAAGGIDAMVHAIEAYTTRHKKNPLSDLLAVEALRILAANLATVCHDGADRRAREAVLYGSTLAGQAFANAPVGAVHALAYPLGGHFHISHGLSNALMLVPVLRFNASAAAPLYAELGEAIGAATSGDIAERAAAFIRTIETIIESAGAPRRLGDVGVPRKALPMLAADAMKQTRLLGNNPVDVDERDALRLYEEAF